MAKPPRTPERSPAPIGYGESALFTDLYELTMAQAFIGDGLGERIATFSLFFRGLPPSRNYLLACGLETVLEYLENWALDPDTLEYLESLEHFTPAFRRWLRDVRFEGEVRAVPEGTPIFGSEPVLEITGPIAIGQLFETFVTNQVHMQTLQASKAARVISAAQGRPVVDFGARRFHGTDSAVKAARAFAVAGVSGTSNVMAGRRYGLPLSGTMGHSFIQAFSSELDAFRAYSRQYRQTTLVVDTYDTLQGVRNVIELAGEHGSAFDVEAIRLDSGDLADLAWKSRQLLDDAGLRQVRIFASGGLDEHSVAEIVAKDAPVDGFGVGTHMGVSSDAPALHCVYKLTAFDGTGRIKLSPGKAVLPGRKQIWRADGEPGSDVVGRAEEYRPTRALLHTMMRGGRRLPAANVTLPEARACAADELARLPARIRSITPADPPYQVDVSAALRDHGRYVESTLPPRGGARTEPPPEAGAS